MLAEQIPGTLFVLLVALAAFMNQDTDVVLILAVGCAAGWFSFNPTLGQAFWYIHVLLMGLATILLTTRIFL